MGFAVFLFKKPGPGEGKTVAFPPLTASVPIWYDKRIPEMTPEEGDADAQDRDPVHAPGGRRARRRMLSPPHHVPGPLYADSPPDCVLTRQKSAPTQTSGFFVTNTT